MADLSFRISNGDDIINVFGKINAADGNDFYYLDRVLYSYIDRCYAAR